MERQQKSILIVTSSIDYTIDYIINKFQDVSFYRLNVDMINDYSITINNVGWEICSATGSLTSADTGSIYYRKPMLPNLSSLHPKYQRMAGNDIISVIDGLVDSFEGRVITRPSLLHKTENKTFQLQELSKIGLIFPQSIIGNSLNMDRHIKSPQKIIKPLTTGKIDLGKKFEIFQTNLLTTSVGDISLTPVYIQQYIKKIYEVRITYFMGETWPVRIDTTDEIDWRKNTAHNRYSKIELPADVVQSCNLVMQKLGLSFGAFDFIVTPNKEWVFLEVNPNGQWLWLELELGLNISDKIIDYLAKGD